MTREETTSDQTRLGTVTMPQLAAIAVALVAAAAMAWAFLPTADGGGGAAMMGAAMSATVADEGASMSYAGMDGSISASGIRDAIGAGPDMGEHQVGMTPEEQTARLLAWNWLNGALTNDEYFEAMSYLYRSGYMGVGASGLGGAGGIAAGSPNEWADGTLDGPDGAGQAWCKPGLVLMEDANTGDTVCVPMSLSTTLLPSDSYGGGTAGLDWVRPLGVTESAEPDTVVADTVVAYPTKQYPVQTGAWKGDAMASNGGVAKTMVAKIEGLNDLNERLLRTIDALQVEILALRAGNADGTGGVGVGGYGDGVASVVVSEDEAHAASSAPIPAATAGSGSGMYGPAKRADRYQDSGTSGPTSPGEGEACLHGTTMQLTSVIDPTTLAETDGSLGTTPMPAGKYTILLSSGSSSPLFVRLQLEGHDGMFYDQEFNLTDTGEPPGEDTTVWDYNSGLVELVVPVEQMVNATAAVDGGDDLPVFATLAKCR